MFDDTMNPAPTEGDEGTTPAPAAPEATPEAAPEATPDTPTEGGEKTAA